MTSTQRYFHSASEYFHGGDIFALDLGTTKFCLATLHYPHRNEKPVIKKVAVPSGGMRGGMVCHMGEAQKALDHLLYLAEKEFSQDIRQVHLGVAGSHLRSRIAKANLDLGGDTITAEDQKTLHKICAKTTPQGYELLHNIPLNYQVDSREIVSCATGFSGDFLGGTSFMIEADKNYLRDLIRLCNICGLSVKKLYAEPYASASVVASHEQKVEGVVVIDIGGGTTDGIAFKGGKPVKLFTVNVGGQIMSQDVATCLRISRQDAHRIKHEWGLDHLLHPCSSVRKVKQKNQGTASVTSQDVFDILSCRISELYDLIVQELGGKMSSFASGLVMTGGGSELKALSEYLHITQSLYVTKSNPSLPKLANQTPCPEDRTTETTPYATACGLLYLAWLEEQKTNRIGHKATLHVRSFFNWLKEIA